MGINELSSVQVGDILVFQDKKYLVLKQTYANVMGLDIDTLEVRWITSLENIKTQTVENKDGIVQLVLSKLVANSFAKLSTEDRIDLIRYLVLELMVS